MFEFMTIRELYEIVLSASHVELDSLEYVQPVSYTHLSRDGVVGPRYGKRIVRRTALKGRP